MEQPKDRVDAIHSIYESHPESQSIENLGKAIDALFSDDISPITLCTVHRAKGLESDRVFISSSMVE
ncbi:3'-5' exonuclease [Roseofilum reptotaenium CS-1145]|uniref:3'-5' exonuclease n=1 Tax=Roseofilum reptotaenium TaxID=1233427 RepID=UPI00232EFEDC|nr:3'-5' exonuclease [Roseofilum reptotaenium]MDB9516294.1 3'-5' exonuclease [Roseofilum reptotaenium CS-1145]